MIHRRLQEQVASVEAVLSIACGVGVQTMNEHFPDTATIPGLNTKFMGAPVQHGLWQSMPAAATASCSGPAACAVARCAKRLFNGPCGGSSRGRCEVDPDVDCVWQLIHDRLEKLGKLDNLEIIRPARDWRPSTNAGQRKVRFDEVML